MDKFYKKSGRDDQSFDGENNKKETSWGGVASWYDDYLEKDDTYQNKVILPNILRLVDLKEDERLLDPACGQGFFVREFEKTGGEIWGSDISDEMIQIAKEKGGKSKYFVAPASKLSFAKNNFFDKAVIVLALENIEDFFETISEVSNKLKNGGTWVLVINHPSFRIPKRSSWGFDEEKGIQFRRVDEYMSESRVEISMNPSQENSITTLSFHRPLQAYFKAFEKSGLVVSRIEEWISHKKSEDGPRKDAENKSRKEFPMFMAIVAKKI
jgi:ubiquinone/menaquinone biosynthesis C-methylase UbiE